MRISTSWAQQLSVNAMLNQQAKVSNTQMQLSTGLKNLTPADDPIAAKKVLDFQSSIDRTIQYKENIDVARERNTLEGTALMSVTDQLQRARELAIQSLNSGTGTLTVQDRKIIGLEVRQILDSVLNVANTKNANGEYLFSGDLSTTQPFKKDETIISPLTKETGYVYQGGINQRTLQIAEDRRVADGDIGFNVFEDIPSVSLAANAKEGKQSVFEVLETFANALEGVFPQVPGTVTGDRFLKYGTVLPLPGVYEFDLSVDGGVPETVSIAPGEYASIDELVGAVNAGIASTTTLSPNVVVRASGNNIEFVSVTQGATSSVTLSNQVGGVLTSFGFSDPQTGTGVDVSTSINPDGTPADITSTYIEVVNDVLEDIDAALESFNTANAKVGARLRALDDQQNQNDKFILDMNTILSSTKDLDFTEAITRFNMENMNLQAAQQSYFKVQSLSLFNYL